MQSSEYRFRGLLYKEPGFTGRTPDRIFDEPWSEQAIGALFPELTIEDKNLTPMWAALSLRPGCTRSEDGIAELYAVVLDKDCGDIGELARVGKHLAEQKRASLLYTAHSHRSLTKAHEDTGTKGPFDSFRVVLPTSRPVAPSEYRALVAAVYQTGIVPPDLESYSFEVAGRTVTLRSGEKRPAKPRGWDPAAYKPAQPWYVPCSPASTTTHAVLEVHQGTVLDVDWLLSLKAAPITSRKVYADTQGSDAAREKFSKVARALESAGFALGDDDPDVNCRGICPSCQDPSPSLLVRAKGERVVMTCFAGCETKTILTAVGLRFSDLETAVVTEARRAERAAQPDSTAQLLEGVDPKARSAEQVKAAQNDVERAIQRAFGSDRIEPYTTEELAAMAPTEKRWLLLTPAGYFLRAPGGGYIPVIEKAVLMKARDMLAPAYPAGVYLTELTDKGETKLKTLEQVKNEFGQAPTHTAYSYTAPVSALDGDTFVQRTGVPKTFVPEKNEKIARWLELFAGDQIEPFLDWLATLTQLSKPTAGLCIMGTSGAGKDLLVEGLAEIWGGSRLSFERALHKFNNALIDSPLVVANEEVRTPREFSGSAADALKEMISDVKRKVEAKYGGAVDLRGCLRVIIASNANGALSFSRSPTPSDIVALDERILLLRPSEQCKDYLESLGGLSATEAWVSGGGIARHVAWLQQTRVVKPGTRFLVQGRGGMSDLLSADGKGSASVLKALLDALLGPLDQDPRIVHLWEGSVWASASRLKAAWATYGGKDELPEDFGGATENVFERGVSANRTVGTEQIKMRRVKWPVLLRAAEKGSRLDELIGLRG